MRFTAWNRSVSGVLGIALGLLGCVGGPSPLAPALRGSIGVPHRGVLTVAKALPKKGDGYVRLRENGIHWGNPRLVATIEHAARAVAHERSGAPLVVGDMSARFGGEASGHRSHRSGRDADLLIYATTPDGRPVESPGFVRFGPDGLAKTEGGKYLRIDLEREWLLIKNLISSPEGNIQWLFLARWLEAQVVEYARARGEDPELVWYAETVLLQPRDSSAHDDHLHLRIACTPDEAVAGCMGGGPHWPWLEPLPELDATPDSELAQAIAGDLLPGSPGAAAAAAP